MLHPGGQFDYTSAAKQVPCGPLLDIRSVAGLELAGLIALRTTVAGCWATQFCIAATPPIRDWTGIVFPGCCLTCQQRGV